VSITIYFEGGGDRQDLKTLARKGLSQFVERMGFKGRMPKIVACGSRRMAYDRFKTALRESASLNNELPILLVDSEDSVTGEMGAWEHLHKREHDRWERPPGADDDQAHLMVRCMEAWFLTDVDALKRYFGNGFAEHALPRRTAIEDIDRHEISASLQQAAKNTAKNGYEKGRDSFRILGMSDPRNVIGASPNAKRFFDALQKYL
jgi:hypothetical protein